MFCEKGVLRNFANSQERPAREALFKACNYIKKESLAQVFSCEFCEISKNTFLYRTPPVAASGANTKLDTGLGLVANVIS